MRKRILLVNLHFGESGATGGFRWAKTIADLSGRGWQATVTTCEQPTPGSATDSVLVVRVPFKETAKRAVAWLISMAKRVRQSLLRLLNSSDHDHDAAKTHGISPGPVQRPIERPRGCIDELRLPSPRDREPFWSGLSRFSESVDHSVWAWRAYRHAVKLARETQVKWDVVVVSSPPHWTQLAGLLIQRRFDIPYVADLRDPWVTALPRDLIAPSLWARVNCWLERRVLQRADLVIFNTSVAQKLSQTSFGAGGDRAGTRSVVIANGYDHAPFDATSVDFEKFRVVFAGFIYPYMDVRVVFRAFRRFVDAQGLDAKRASLEFIGAGASFNRVSFADIAFAYGIEPFFELSKRVSRDAALQRQAQAAVLIAMDYPYPSAIVMKAYDYLCMPGFILALTRRGSALSRMLDELALEWFGFEDEDRIVAFLETCYRRWQARDMQPDKDPLQLHAREKRSAEIVAALEQVLSHDGA